MKSAQSIQAQPPFEGHQNDLVEIVALLAHHVETLDSMIETHRPGLERAGRGAYLDQQLALHQWTRIRARAVDVVNRAQDTLEKVRQNPIE